MKMSSAANYKSALRINIHSRDSMRISPDIPVYVSAKFFSKGNKILFECNKNRLFEAKLLSTHKICIHCLSSEISTISMRLVWSRAYDNSSDAFCQAGVCHIEE